ncbi:MAG: hypothetical protein R3B91_05635 [Planctomycetaceae bacterium]
MLDPFFERFNMPEHHRATASTTQLVPDAIHFQPAIGQHFPTCHQLAHGRRESHSPSRQAPQTGVHQPLEDRLQRQFGHFVKVPQLWRTKPVHIQLRELRLHASQQVFVPLQRQLGV